MAYKAVDVIVIGGGPAGSISALTLAKQQRSVVLLEKDKMPRFHIGESLLPYMAGLIDRLGIRGAIEAQGYVEKYGGEFIDPYGMRFFTPIFRADFAKQGNGRHLRTFQVTRSNFDQTLLGQAVAAGAQVIEDANVTDFVMDGDRITGVRYQRDGVECELRSKFVIDASGRAGKIANRFGLREKIDGLQMVAIFRHYRGLDERYNPGHEGDIQVGAYDRGWVWAIPLSKSSISVGTVMPREVLRTTLKEVAFEEYLAGVPRIQGRLTGTYPVMDLQVETDYSYHADTVVGSGWVMVGDAGCFGDPMFSGGVLVASVTGARAGEVIGEVLKSPDREDDLINRYADFFKTGYDTYIRLIRSFYEGELMAVVADAARTTSRDVLEKYVVRLVGGDFWSEHNPIAQEMRRRPEWDTFAPFTRTRKCPIYPHLEDADRDELAAARLRSTKADY